MSKQANVEGVVFAMKKPASFSQTLGDLRSDHGPLYGSSFYEMSRPILWLQLILGRTPYHVKSGWVKSSVKSAPFVYSMCLQCVAICFHVYFHENIFTQWYNMRNGVTFENILFSSMVLMQVPSMVWVVHSWFFEVPKIVRNYNDTATLQNKMTTQVVVICEFQKKTKLCVVWMIGLYFVGSFVLTMFHLSSKFSEAPLLLLISFVLNFVAHQSYTVMWCFNFMFIRGTSKKLKLQMDKLEEDRPYHIKMCRKTWLSIWEQAQKYSDSFALTVLLMLISYGIVFVTALYGLIVSIRRNSPMCEILSILPYLLASFSQVWAIFESAHQAKTNLSKTFLDSLIHLDKDTLDHRSIEEIDRFVNEIVQSDVNITLKGYIFVDRALLVKFLSYAVTYLIVLLQFKETEDHTNQDGSLKMNNSTYSIS